MEGPMYTGTLLPSQDPKRPRVHAPMGSRFKVLYVMVQVLVHAVSLGGRYDMYRTCASIWSNKSAASSHSTTAARIVLVTGVPPTPS